MTKLIIAMLYSVYTLLSLVSTDRFQFSIFGAQFGCEVLGGILEPRNAIVNSLTLLIYDRSSHDMVQKEAELIIQDDFVRNTVRYNRVTAIRKYL